MKFFRNVLPSLFALLNHRDKKKGVWIIMLMSINGVLDFFSIASFLPLIFLIVNPRSISDHKVIKQLYDLFTFASTTSFIITLAISILIFTVIKNVLGAGIVRAKSRYAYGIANNLSLRSLEHYRQMSYVKFSQVDFTKELNQISNYPFAFANNIVLPITILISEGFVSFFVLAGIALYDYHVLILLFIILLPTLLMYYVKRKSLKTLKANLKEKLPLLSKYTLQVVEGFSDIKVAGKENFFYERVRKTTDQISQIFIKDQSIQSGTVRLTEITVSIIICSIIIYSVLTQQYYQQTLLLLGVYAGASFRAIPSMNRILIALQQIRLHEYLFEEFNDLKNFHFNAQESSISSMTFHKTVELKNISFAYPNRKPLLRDISLRIHKGEKVGLVGKSGEGKTTLLLILLRFLRETAGEIRVDNSSIHDETAWRRLLGYVPQNPYIVDGTITENIAFGIPSSEINEAKVFQLIDDLDLREMVAQLPDGVNTNIGERGIKLSGGQRQRIAIARALYADAEILLLDEITNQVHAHIELEILNILDNLSKENKTIIIVTHKIIRADFFNTIYNLENGKLQEVMMQS